MLRRTTISLMTGAVLWLHAPPAPAHFQILVPNTDLADADTRVINLDLIFTHPMKNGPVMEMKRPTRFGLLLTANRTDLSETLVPHKLQDKTAYRASYTVKRPGDHIFFVEPAPYWEAAEQKMIIHYTKVVVNAFGEEAGWDSMVGFPVEIEPLVRPYGVWTGNAFRGIVRRNGNPVPFAKIEVEYWNSGNAVKPPADAFVTQVIKADASGTFSYTMPKAGWWSFAALIDGDHQVKSPDGKDVDVELGGLIWIRCVNME